MDKSWYDHHLKQIRVKADARYTPELNVDLPLSEIFDGISRSKAFYVAIREKYGKLMSEFKYIDTAYKNPKLKEVYDELSTNIRNVFIVLDDLKKYDTKPIPWETIREKIKKAEDRVDAFADLIDAEKRLVEGEPGEKRKDGSHSFSPSERMNYNAHHLREVRSILHYFVRLSSSPKAMLLNSPYLLLNGSAGIGKTHLLCDLVTQRIGDDKGGLLLFSAYFSNDEEFWPQALRQLGLEKMSLKDVLSSLDVKGKKTGCRSIIVIDALNENTLNAPDFWKNKLPDLISQVRKYENIALILSVRNGYEKDVIPDIIRSSLTQVEHHGFSSDVIWFAINSFFKHYNITFPEVPLLHAEFYNPLFLKFFCEKNKNSKPVLKGGNALKDIFEDFVIEIGIEVLKTVKPGSQKRENGKNVLWDGIVKDMALWMSDNVQTRIPISELKKIVEKYFPHDAGTVISLMEHRVLLSRLDWDTEISYTFTYDKFSDHIIVRHLLMSVDKTKRKTTFWKNGKCGKFIQSFRYDQGMLEALCIQVPEFYKKELKKELFDLAPYVLKNQSFESAFKESLIWRDPETIDSRVVGIVERNIRGKRDFFLDPLLSLASFPKHALNALLLDSLLRNFSMPERDSWWSVFLHNEYGEKGAVDRLLEWSWSDEDRSHISDDSIWLVAIALSWFLTTPNRYVRDKATKGLVSLLQDRIGVLRKLLEHFKDVNDIYVLERLYAVSYGCVLRRRKDKEGIKNLATWIYENIFKNGKPPTHVLLRDYARGIIEVARLEKIDVPMSGVNPPYGSAWPAVISEEVDLRKKYYPEDYFKDKTKDRGFLDIWSSIMYNFGSMGDFGKYEIDPHVGNWSGRRLVSPEPDRKKMLEDFKKRISKKQRVLFEKATNIFFGISSKTLFRFMKDNKNLVGEIVEPIDYEKKDQEDRERREKGMAVFKESLSPKDRNFFEKELETYLDERGSINDPFENFDTGLAQRWIFQRVVDMGYNPKIHGSFDSRVNHYDNSGRSGHKAERIGKKYQWIALHEFTGMVADNFQFRNRWGMRKDYFHGPWNPYVRDIDPSFIMKNDEELKSNPTFNNWRKGAGKYEAWTKVKEDNKWLKTPGDLPNVSKLIEMVDDDGKKWLTLNGIIVWQQDTPPEYKKYDVPTREFFYIIKGFIVKKKDSLQITKWLKKKGYGNWMPESSPFYESFIGEYPNSESFKDLRGDFNIWTKEGKYNGGLEKPVTVADDDYLNEFTSDCSYDGSISMKLPSKWLVNKMKLEHKNLDGRFYNNKGILTAYATNVFEEHFPSVLLIDKDQLTGFLKKNECEIIWTLLGEKQFIGGSMSGREFKGRLNLTGVFELNKDSCVIGAVSNEFEPPK